MIFQWESDSATAYLRQLFSDSTINAIRKQNPDFSYMDLLSMGNGAIRPAGASYRDQLAKGIYKDNGHEALNEFMKSTLGFVIYQETLMNFLHQFCGYTMGMADVVRKGFAKKTGTEKFIPQIEAGFIKTMGEKYNVPEDEAKVLVKDFIQVVIDASDYLFSKNHSDPYSWIGYICGYLRYYYPLEFISTALNIFEDKADKTVAIIEYAKKRNIKISAIKFRFSQAKYSFDKETNQIFKGLASIKGLNAKIAEEMYALKDNTYTSFIDLAYDLKYKTSLNSAQLRTLILLDFFSEFGECNLLLAQNVLFERFYNKKQIKKDILAEYSISEEMARNNAAKETAKMFAFDNMRGFLLEVVSTVRAKPRTLAEKLKDQNQLLGYVDVRGEQYKGIALVMEVNTKYSPRLKMYSLKNGNTVDCKIPKKTFNKQQVKAGDLLIIQGQERRQKTRRAEDGEFVPIAGEYDIWVTKYKKTTI